MTSHPQQRPAVSLPNLRCARFRAGVLVALFERPSIGSFFAQPTVRCGHLAWTVEVEMFSDDKVSVMGLRVGGKTKECVSGTKGLTRGATTLTLGITTTVADVSRCVPQQFMSSNL